ncbi:hypothetical protein NQ315_011242, partial [Exocentrus adspersus]
MEIAPFKQCWVSPAYEQACPLKAVSGRRVRWWNRPLEGLRQFARRTLNRIIKGRADASWDDYRAARREFKKELRCSKRSGWRAYCTELESLPQTARLMQILSCEKRENIGSLKRADGTWTTSSKGCLELLLETHFAGESTSTAATKAESARL